jgi:hypothetical protein
VPETPNTVALQLRTAARLLRTKPISIRSIAGPLDERLVFVIGCPRSGTTFLGNSIGSCLGFVDLGEVAPFKAALPRLTGLAPSDAAPQIRRILATTRRLALVGHLRAVEQTPEAAFVAPALTEAFPEARLVHIVRDGRDVVCSLLERGWLSRGRSGVDDAGAAYGSGARFWVEPERHAEFEAASDTRRAAWAWRRYVTAALAAPAPVTQVRYEDLATRPADVAAELARALEMPVASLSLALSAAHGDSLGRFREELTPEQLAEVEHEAGEALAALGYLH